MNASFSSKLRLSILFMINYAIRKQLITTRVSNTLGTVALAYSTFCLFAVWTRSKSSSVLSSGGAEEYNRRKQISLSKS